MPSLKISELPTSTNYASSNAYIPGIVDGINVKFPASDLGQSETSTWKDVISDSSSYGIIPSSSSKVIYNGKYKSLFNMMSDYDRYVLTYQYYDENGYVKVDSNGGNGFTFHANGYIKIGVQNGISSSFPEWGLTDEEFCIQMDDMSVKMVMNHAAASGSMSGFAVVPRLDGTTINGTVVHQGGPEVIGMALSLQVGGTQPDHALRKDQIEALITSGSTSALESVQTQIDYLNLSSSNLKNEVMELVETVVLEKDSTDIVVVETASPSSSSAYGNYGWVQINPDVLEAGYFTKFTIWAYSNATASGEYNLVVYEQDESAPNGWKKLGWSNERVKMSANKIFEWTFDGIKIDGSKPIRIVAAYDPTTLWGTTTATSNAAPIRIKIITTALGEDEVQDTYISSSVVLSDNYLNSNGVYYRAACGFTITEYDESSLNKLDKHISDTTIHNTLEEVNESVKKEQLLSYESYEFNRDGDVSNNATVKTIFLDASKVIDGYLTGITLRGAKSSGTTTQLYLAVYQINEAGTAYEWIGASTNTDNFSSSSTNPTPLHSWSFDNLLLAGGRQVAIVALASPIEPATLSSAVQSMRLGTITFEANTTTVADTAPDATLAATVYNYSVAINFQMNAIVGEKYALRENFNTHAEDTTIHLTADDVNVLVDSKLEEGAYATEEALNAHINDEDKHIPQSTIESLIDTAVENHANDSTIHLTADDVNTLIDTKLGEEGTYATEEALNAHINDEDKHITETRVQELITNEVADISGNWQGIIEETGTTSGTLAAGASKAILSENGNALFEVSNDVTKILQEGSDSVVYGIEVSDDVVAVVGKPLALSSPSEGATHAVQRQEVETLINESHENFIENVAEYVTDVLLNETESVVVENTAYTTAGKCTAYWMQVDASGLDAGYITSLKILGTTNNSTASTDPLYMNIFSVNDDGTYTLLGTSVDTNIINADANFVWLFPNIKITGEQDIRILASTVKKPEWTSDYAKGFRLRLNPPTTNDTPLHLSTAFAGDYHETWVPTMSLVFETTTGEKYATAESLSEHVSDTSIHLTEADVDAKIVTPTYYAYDGGDVTTNLITPEQGAFYNISVPITPEGLELEYFFNKTTNVVDFDVLFSNTRNEDGSFYYDFYIEDDYVIDAQLQNLVFKRDDGLNLINLSSENFLFRVRYVPALDKWFLSYGGAWNDTTTEETSESESEEEASES